MEDREIDEGQVEDKDISRRDFVRKALQYTAAGAVLGSIAGIGGINPPEAEASSGDFIAFMRSAQECPEPYELANDFVDMVLCLCGTQSAEVCLETHKPTGCVPTIVPYVMDKPAALQEWFACRGYKLDYGECKGLLEICCRMNAEHQGVLQRLVTGAAREPGTKCY